jgi:hypothetical protein
MTNWCPEAGKAKFAYKDGLGWVCHDCLKIDLGDLLDIRPTLAFRYGHCGKEFKQGRY